MYGSWGVFYDIFKLNLPRGSFGGDKWISYYYTLDTPNFENLRDSAPNCPPSCPGTLIRTFDFRAVSVTAGLDVEKPGQFKPMRTQELSFGLERQLNNVMATSIRFVHKQLDRAIDDIGDLDADGEVYIIANPGEASPIARVRQPADADPAEGDPQLRRIEATLDKRLSNRWMFTAATSGAGSTATTRASSSRTRTAAPTRTSRHFDYPSMMFDQKGTAGLDRCRPIGRTRSRPSSSTSSPSERPSASTSTWPAACPSRARVAISRGSNYPLNYLGRNSDGRRMCNRRPTCICSTKSGSATSGLQFSFNVFNVFNQEAAVSKFSTYQRTNEHAARRRRLYRGELDFAQLIAQQGIEQDPRFLQNNGFQAPIAARFGVRFLF